MRDIVHIPGSSPYQYTPLLLELQRRTNPASVPLWLQEVQTPLRHHVWMETLAEHQDQTIKKYILNGGFHIGFNYGQCSCRSATSNMQSALENVCIVQAYLDMEVALKRIVGPYLAPRGTPFSPFGVILKPDQPGKWRLILNLSSPEGRSINDGIGSVLCSLCSTYIWMK